MAEMPLEEANREAIRRIHEAKERRATWLDLGDLPLVSVPAEIAEIDEHLRTLSLGTMRIVEQAGKIQFEYQGGRPTVLTDLTNLSFLKHVESLNLESCTQVPDLEPLRNLNQLQSLDLSGCNQLTDLDPLRNFSQLQRLDVSRCSQLTDLEPLQNLSQLQSLNVSWCSQLTDLEPLQNLSQLQSLNVSWCSQLTDLEPLQNLSLLQSLDVSSCSQLTDLEPLQNLSQLQSLNVSWCSQLTDLEPLQNLSLLQSLDVSSCSQLTDLEPLQNLSLLQSLDVSDCKQLSDLEPLRNLSQLQSLKLNWCHQLTDLEPLRNLSQLQSLKLNWCHQLTDLEPLRNLSQLQSLKLNWCHQLTDLEPLRNLSQLQSLDLRECQGLELSRLFPLLHRLPTLILYQSRFIDFPPELCGQKDNENVITAVRAYFADKPTTPNFQLKVFVLGNGRAGKTKLVGRLRGTPYRDIPEGSTHGVRLHEHELEVPGIDHPVCLNLWDFGGQDIYHGTHALFLRGTAVYLILWTPNLENENEISEAGLKMKNRYLQYWFDYLRAEAGEQREGKRVVTSPVLLIQSQCDSKADERDPPYLPDREEFPNLYVMRVSAKNDRGMAHFRESLQEAVAEIWQRHPQPPLPESWIRVRSTIRALPLKQSPTRVLTLKEFRQLCPPEISSPEVLLTLLHGSGVVFYRPGLFADQIIVDQSWALDAIYTVSTRNEKFQRHLIRTRGRFTREDLELFFWSKNSQTDQNTFLSYMEQCGICFRITKDWGHEEPIYIAPEFLPSWDLERAKQFRRLLAAEPDAEVKVSYPMLHDGITRHFLAKLGQHAGDKAEYWRFGVHFHDGKTDSEVLIRTEGNTIWIQARDGHAVEVLKILVEVLQKSSSSQVPTVQWSQAVDEPIRVETSSKDGAPENQLLPKYSSRSVFVSYSHEERSRNFVTQELIPRLEDLGWRVVWDAADLRSGVSISKFVDQVREVPYLLPVIAGDYLKKRWCLSELLGFFEARGCNDEAFRQQAVVAADLNQIDEPLLRSGHARTSERLFNELLDQGGKHLDTATHAQCKKLVGWSIRLADILHLLADDLGERGLTDKTAEKVVALLDGRFQAKKRGR